MPQEITKNTQHTAEGLLLFIDRYKNKPRLASLISIFLDQVQELEDALFELITDRTIDAAVGVQLDILGAIVGQPDRLGLSVDDEYRTIIKARIKVNRSDGHAEQLIEILRLITTLTGVLQPAEILLLDTPPAAIRISLLTDIGTLDPGIAFNLLDDARGAGIKLDFIYTTTVKADTFTFGGDGPNDPDKGFFNSDTPSGGKFGNKEG